jgi:hypothetical protein
MKTPTTRLLALATISLSVPAFSMASNASVLDRCVSAFMTDLSNQTTTTLRLRDARYISDQTFTPFHDSTGALVLTARDAHDNHAVARAECTINSHGEVDLRAEPLVADNLH